ncbi:hypothetical protein LTS18_008889 [Coniosporium uncinatum]|uniref:Uncharacterized protein n=1 Tax=Coniosporium uncinatum TaxID=93489 RepID=A0ACC3D157_9PEZI|nr:hypothetical protein LTS18_008889 [Coniosporium uncinatum]
MGVLQALEATKIISSGSVKVTRSEPGVAVNDNVSSITDGQAPATPPSLLLFSAYANPPFRSIRLRSRKHNCATCSSEATITRDSLASDSLTYVQFCGALSPINVLSPGERLSAAEYAKLREQDLHRDKMTPEEKSHILVDVREKVQFELCSLAGSVNVPFSELVALKSATTMNGHASSVNARPSTEWLGELLALPPEQSIHVVCRLGNDSQIAVRKFKELGLAPASRKITDIKGGLQAWREEVDPEFPEY